MDNQALIFQLKSSTSSNKQPNNFSSILNLNNSKQNGNKNNYLNDLNYSSSVLNSNGNGDYSSSNNDTSNASDSYFVRETGIIEKLMPSYGFILCSDRQARLFFHYSHFSGNIEHLRLGDLVEFEMKYDKRTCKPIASFVVKVTSEAIGEEVSLERVTGFITIEVTDEKEGRVAYENRGECFFLPFTKEDLEDKDLELKAKDRVNFFITKNNLGNLRARRICLEEPLSQRLQGIICTLKDNFGFIERADVVKEIFFHSSECKNFKELILGDNVQYGIQKRNKKQVAVNIEKLLPNSVIIEDIDSEKIIGQILKNVERTTNNTFSRTYSNFVLNNTSESTPGNIIFRKNDIEIEIPFRECDVLGEFTLNLGDLVQFNICTDKRDATKHATNIEFLDESFDILGEKRERGFVVFQFNEGKDGIICLPEKNKKLIAYHSSENLDVKKIIKMYDEVEFTILNEPLHSYEEHAIRIKVLSSYSSLGDAYINLFDNILVDKKNLLSPIKETGFIVELKDNCGSIKCFDTKESIVYFTYDSSIENNYFNLYDEVEFSLEYSSPGNVIAYNVKKLHQKKNSKDVLAYCEAKNEKENNLKLPTNVENFFDLYNINVTTNNSRNNKSQIDSSQFAYSLLNSNKNLVQQNLSHFNQQSSTKDDLNQLDQENVDLWSQISFMLENKFTDLVNDNILNTNLFLNNNFELSSDNVKIFEPSVQLNDTSQDYELPINKETKQPVSTNINKNNNTILTNEGTALNEKNSNKTISKGVVAALKESYGFIESEDHQNEIFFHYSVYNGNINNLNLLQEVEYSCVLKNGKLSAEYVKKISSGTIINYEVLPEVLNGIVTRSVRCMNPEQNKYCGLIEQKEDLTDNLDNSPNIYEFSMVSLADIHDFVQKNDAITFQIALMKNGQRRAVNVKPIREKFQAIVDAIKGNFGFLNYEIEEGKKLFFHMSEVKDPNTVLIEGDTVEFVIVNKKKTGKISACSVVKINDVATSQRPDRLIIKIKQQGNDDLNQNKNVVVRQPKGPDGTKGFSIPRKKE